MSSVLTTVDQFHCVFEAIALAKNLKFVRYFLFVSKGETNSISIFRIYVQYPAQLSEFMIDMARSYINGISRMCTTPPQNEKQVKIHNEAIREFLSKVKRLK